MMKNKIELFLSGGNLLKDSVRKINTVEELQDLPNHSIPNSKMVHNVDLSALDLSKYPNLIEGQLPELYFQSPDAARQNVIINWTDSVIWPKSDKMPKGVSPQDVLEKSKTPVGMTGLHKQNINGANIGIAIIDQRLNLEHPEYKDRIKHYEVVGEWPNNDTTTPDPHGSLVSGLSVGKTCGTAPGADLYYFAANNWNLPNKDNIFLRQGHHRYFKNMAIRKVIELNKTLPEHKKIRFLSCSWGAPDDQFAEEGKKLFDECERNGIMVIGGAYKKTSVIKCDRRYAIKDEHITDSIGVPTDGKTSPFYLGGYRYTRQGGNSSVIPYLAGVYACACQDNQIFFTRPNWQNDLDTIMRETAIESEHGGKMINPVGIRERVTQIAREMELQIAKQKATQHE